jgi:calmodulin
MCPELVFTLEDRENFKNAFDAFDENRDHAVETITLGKLLRAVGYNPLPEEVEDMMADIGADTFDFESFLYVLHHHARAVDPEGELVEAFRVFDKKGTGKLETGQVREILKHIKQPFTDDQISELFVQADIKPGALEVDYIEFVKVMLEF